MSKITAVASLYAKVEGPDQTGLYFTADYNDERNKAWSKYTPSLNLNMTVLNEVADKFELRGTYLLSFEPI